MKRERDCVWEIKIFICDIEISYPVPNGTDFQRNLQLLPILSPSGATRNATEGHNMGNTTEGRNMGNAPAGHNMGSPRGAQYG